MWCHVALGSNISTAHGANCSSQQHFCNSSIQITIQVCTVNFPIGAAVVCGGHPSNGHKGISHRHSICGVLSQMLHDDQNVT